MAPQRSSQFWRALGYAWQFGYSIAVPLVLFALVGRLLDRRMHTAPWLLLLGILLAIVSSSILLVRKATSLLRDIEGSQRPPRAPNDVNDDRASH